jgi:hypothetical protein
MHLWTSLTSHFGNKPKPTNTKVINKMNNSEYHSNETRVRIERSQTIPLSPSNERASNPLPRRRVDPSQTLQLPIPESQKAETPFVNPLGAQSPLLLTPPHSPIGAYPKLPSSERTSHSFVEAAAKLRRDGEDNGTWQGGCVKIIAIDAESEKGEKKRSTKEWKSDEVEPAKKKSRDHSRMIWSPRQNEKVVSHWGPNMGIRRGYT